MGRVMGRARLTLKRIPNNAIRKSTFMKRREGLKKKVFEYSSSRVKAEACLIVYDDANGDDHQKMMTWPEDLTKVHSIIEKYESQKNEEEEPPIMFCIQDYFQNKKDLVEAEISKVRKEIIKIKYSTWDPRFNNLEDEQLLDFIAVLDAKSKACRERISMLKMQHQVDVNLAQTNGDASNSSQISFMKNNFQSQLITTPVKPLHVDNQLESSLPEHVMDSQSQMLHFDPNLMPLMSKNNGVMDSANQVGLPLDCAQQVDSANHVAVPLGSTKQSDSATDSTNQFDEPDWDSLHELVDCASQRGMPGYWPSQLHDLVSCASLLDDFVFHNSFPESQNVQQEADLHSLAPPTDGFQTDYYNMNQEK